jgi:hypothetical protein
MFWTQFASHRDSFLVQEICRFLRPAPILLLTYLFQPVDHLAVPLFLNGDVRHRCGCCGAMPVLLAGREPDHIAWPNLLDWTSPVLRPAAASRDDECLTKGMRVPCRPRARLESYARALNKRRIGCLKKRIDPNCTGEPIRRAFSGSLLPNSFDFQWGVLSGDLVRPSKVPARKHVSTEAAGGPFQLHRRGPRRSLEQQGRSRLRSLRRMRRLWDCE